MMSARPFRPSYGLFSSTGSKRWIWWGILLAVTITSIWMARIPEQLSRVGAARERPLSARQVARRQEAVRLMREAMIYLSEESPPGFGSDNDPNDTGLIGVEWSSITSTLGDLSSKRTAVSPLWAGVLVDLFWEKGLQMKDLVVVSMSGSFPGLNLAVLSAAKAMDLRVRAIASPTASMFGANRADWTWTDMMAALERAGWLECSWAVTPGASSDLGRGLLTGLPGELDQILSRSGAPIIRGRSLAEMIEKRWEFFHASGKVKAFVNVGGGHAVLGQCPPPAGSCGWLEKSWTCKATAGLLHRFVQDGVPTLHLLDIKELALENGLPIDPVPLPGWNGGRN